MTKIDYIVPATIEEALAALGRTKGRIIAGGTDLGVIMAEHLIEPEALVDVGALAELRFIRLAADGIRIGAGTLIADIAGSADLPLCLVQGARAIGSPQIRNLATLGGNICNASPCGDTLSPLVALEAEFVIAAPGVLKKVKAADFFLGPKKTVLSGGEILKEVRIPPSPEGMRSAFRMIGKRKGQVISQVNAAACVRADSVIREIRLSVGSVAPVPLRLSLMEKALTGVEKSGITLALVKDLVNKEIKPIDDVRASEIYRRHIAGVLVYDALIEALGGETSA